jgi:hypothetical protein
MKNKNYETFINKNGTAFYVGGVDWLTVFYKMKKEVSVKMNTMILEDEQNSRLILKRTANIFEGDLKILEPINCIPADVIDAVITSKQQDVYEYHAVLNDIYELDSILPTCFTIRGKNVNQFIQNSFRPGLIIELLELAQTNPEHILTIENEKVVEVSEPITLDIEDHVYAEVCSQYSDDAGV